jgi:hypothetical protein
MTKTVCIKNIDYVVENDELLNFSEVGNTDLSPLILLQGLGEMNKEISLFKLFSIFLKDLNREINILNSGQKNGGYVPINILEDFTVYDSEITENLYLNLYKNFNSLKNKFKIRENNILYSIIRLENDKIEIDENILENCVIIYSYGKLNITGYRELYWIHGNKYIYINERDSENFFSYFNFYIKENTFIFNNLLKLLIMVKDAGDDFEKVLQQNKLYIDRWMILDTGSTDNTIKIIQKVLGDIPGELHCEPFINFKESRNRLIELSEENDKKYGECIFNIMLDDTYIINGNLCEFLEILKDDVFADSFSIFIRDLEYKYSSNRILKPWKKLRYKYPVHEIIQTENNNHNCCIPYEKGYIYDERSDYMCDRSYKRKKKDLEILENEINNDPLCSRNYYYIAETYLSIFDYENAYKYYVKRSEMDGFEEEIYDSLYKIAVLGIYNLGFDFETNIKNIEKCYNYNRKYPDGLCLLGLFWLDKDREKSYNYYLEFFRGNYTLKTMNNRYLFYNYHSVLYLLKLADDFENYQICLECIERLKEFSEMLIKDNININYYYRNSMLCKEIVKGEFSRNNKLIYFLIDGGWTNWNGNSYNKGIGGSETFVIRYAETLASFGYKIMVFCKTDNYCLVKDVLYIPINKYIYYCNGIKPRVCFINRYPEYIEPTLKNDIDCYLICHDLFRNNEIIPVCKGVMTISDWHMNYVKSFFGNIGNKNNVFQISYGIDGCEEAIEKVRNSFIYSSFPNRGLYYLLKMFPIILDNFPDSTLNIFCDFNNSYVQQHYRKEISEIEKMMRDINSKYGLKIINHGWIDKKTLRSFWLKSEYWFYPCTFTETCCHTAMECAITKTLAITNDLGALKNTVGDRGIIINGNVWEEGWQYLALNRVLNVMKGLENKENYLERNYLWIKEKSYEKVVRDFEKRFIDL